MAAVHLLPIPTAWTSLVIQIVGLAFMIGCLILTYLTAREASVGSMWAGLAAAALTIFYYPLTRWALHGNEVAVLLAVMSLATVMAFRAAPGRPAVSLLLVLAVSTLVRMDMAVPYLVILAWLLFFYPAARRSNLLWGAGLLVVFLGGQTLWRMWYYGYPFPATYYLKMTGFATDVRLQHGWDVFVEFLIGVKWFLLPMPFLALFLRRDRRTLLLMLLMLAWAAYSVYVGGDAWEHRGGANRFIALGMPAFFVLFSVAAWEVALRGREWAARAMPRWRRLASVGACAGFAGLCALGWLYPNRLTIVGALRHVQPHENGGLRHSLRHPSSGLLAYALLLRPSSFAAPSVRYARDGLILRDLTDDHARIAVAGAGATVYFADRHGIDLYGKSDLAIAVAPAPVDVTRASFKPGHNKFNYQHSVTALKPDVVVDLVLGFHDLGEQVMGDAYQRVRLNGHTMYLRRDSPRIRWDRLPRHRQG
jgi:hypothetical protein